MHFDLSNTAQRSDALQLLQQLAPLWPKTPPPVVKNRGAGWTLKRNHFLLVLLLFIYIYWLCHVWVMLLMFWAADFQHRCTKLSWSFYDLVMLWDMQFLYAKYNPFAPLPFPDTPTGPPCRSAGVCSLVANHIGSIRRDQGKGQRTGMPFQ